MFRKSLFTYLVIIARTKEDTDSITDILEGHNRRASESAIASNKVMVHMKIQNDKEDLANMLNSLEQEFPEGVRIIANPPYSAYVNTESKQRLKSFVIPALSGYIATVIGVFMINLKVLKWDVPLEAFVASIFPAAAAIFLKIYEEYRHG